MDHEAITEEMRRLDELSQISAEASGLRAISRTAMCVGAAYALNWFLGQGDAPSKQIEQRLREETPDALLDLFEGKR